MRKEATTGFEPVIKVLQTSALPLGYVARRKIDGATRLFPPALMRRGSERISKRWGVPLIPGPISGICRTPAPGASPGNRIERRQLHFEAISI